MAPGSGRSCTNTAAAPDVILIETTLADGTVEREMVCAGLTEHRTGTAWNGSRIHEGMDRGAAGSENLPADLQGWYSGRKERLRSNPQTMDRDSNRSCQFTRHKRRRKQLPAIHPHSPRLVGSAPPGPPRFSALRQSRRVKQKRDAPRVMLRCPASGLGAWHGARVASPRRPILRPGYQPFYLRPQRRTTDGARRSRHPGRVNHCDRPGPETGRTLGWTSGAGRVIRDPGASFSQQPPIYNGWTTRTTHYSDHAPPSTSGSRICNDSRSRREKTRMPLDKSNSFREGHPPVVLAAVALIAERS
jgi:hypothetical protein